jgi:hypothetical protein
MKAGLAITLVFAASVGASGPDDQLRAFEIGPVVHLPNGRTATWDTHSSAVRSPLVNDFYTVDSLCVFSDNPVRDAARLAFGWHVESLVLRASDAEVVVRVSWKRTHDAGAPTSVGGTIDLTMKPGSRFEVDRVSPRPGVPNDSGSCGATGMSLEVWMPRPRG